MAQLKEKNQERFAVRIAKGEGIIDAYKEIYNPNNADSNAFHLVKSSDVKQRISELLDIKGMSISDLTIKIRNKLTAKKSDDDDHVIQMKAIERALQLHGVLDKGMSINIDNRKQSINVNDNDVSVDNPQSNTIINSLTKLNKALNLSNGQQHGAISTEDVQYDDIDVT